MLAFPILVIAIYGLLTMHARTRPPRRQRQVYLPGSVHLSATFQPPTLVQTRAMPPLLVDAPRYHGQVEVERPAPPPPVWHTVLSRDAEEQAFLVALRAEPGDAGTRMVYADLLESRGELARAGFVRGAPMRLDYFLALAQTAPGWRAVTSCSRVGCPREDCPGAWSALAPSPIDETLRSCRTCDKAVRHCTGRQDTIDAIARGELVVVELAPPPPPPPPAHEQKLDFDLSD